ncbi:winged helix family transcriptional regulator [Pantoea sp. Bo_2]|uniref:winged helix-turn-helix domain-containing protein n=1 Tax=unclassified Pantoea TaxID=2630326 RepID=UPI00123251BE|nr:MULTISPECIES: winged helix-turn-helix domain-containing protein [unclassified Pantoea]KAA5948828.1 winged helix family transcriptional regulator [Pantoea sp. VH_3]KAA5955211.1 winged helix family transcriptional regulator [Pantoea sp. VH_25]KAA5983668.1 winged helix family transcriptional regulator [Pantoea sp. M_3]KAA6048225.1 winged helix family transcriptional regulator [Pantoea sp. FN_2b]KAA6052866.1 winged helix family transcriptional regulator [Pantoea sp. Bo_5]
MRYKIGGRVIYDATDNTLTLPDCNEPDSQLSITAGALLYYFLHHTELVSRNQVLKKVWDDNGLTSSNSNLNQYLSMLRKTLRHYDVDNIIVSVSRGFLQLNPDFVIEPLTIESVPLTETPPEPISTPLPSISSKVKVVIPPSGETQARYWYLAGSILLSIAMLLVIFTLMNRNTLRVMNFTRISAQPCELLASDEMLHSVATAIYRKNFEVVRQRLNLACHKGEHFVFFYSDRLETNGLGRLFLARCAIHEAQPFSYCDNYFYYAWKSQ